MGVILPVRGEGGRFPWKVQGAAATAELFAHFLKVRSPGSTCSIPVSPELPLVCPKVASPSLMRAETLKPGSI